MSKAKYEFPAIGVHDETVESPLHISPQFQEFCEAMIALAGPYLRTLAVNYDQLQALGAKGILPHEILIKYPKIAEKVTQYLEKPVRLSVNVREPGTSSYLSVAYNGNPSDANHQLFNLHIDGIHAPVYPMIAPSVLRVMHAPEIAGEREELRNILRESAIPRFLHESKAQRFASLDLCDALISGRIDANIAFANAELRPLGNFCSQHKLANFKKRIQDMLFKQTQIPLLGSSYLSREDRVEGAFASIKGRDPTCCQQLFLVENIHDGKLGMIIGLVPDKHVIFYHPSQILAEIEQAKSQR